MKNLYTIPTTRVVCLKAESLIANSMNISDTEVNSGWTQKQDQQSGNSLWDTWSN